MRLLEIEKVHFLDYKYSSTHATFLDLLNGHSCQKMSDSNFQSKFSELYKYFWFEKISILVNIAYYWQFL